MHNNRRSKIEHINEAKYCYNNGKKTDKIQDMLSNNEQQMAPMAKQSNGKTAIRFWEKPKGSRAASIQAKSYDQCSP